MTPVNRRNFLKATGLTVLPAVVPFSVLAHNSTGNELPAEDNIIRFFGDGIMYEPSQYIKELRVLDAKAPLEKDRYGAGGAVAALEKKFEEITGKEKAIFMPSGTMANQLAIAVLSGNNTKVFVQDTSHVYRDEADAAQSVFQKRLMPLAKEETYFTADALKKAIDALGNEEVFASGIGAVSIENPVRRTDGRMIPLEEIKKISAYCRANNIPLHMDGARIHMAAAWSGVSVREYASYADTIYISLYKYLGASAGAILCGPKTVINKMPHLVKIHGGSMYGNWTNAAMALYRLEGVEQRLQQTIERANTLFARLNQVPGIKIQPLEGGTNIYRMQLGPQTDGRVFQEKLNKAFNIRIARPGNDNQALLTVNETLLYRDIAYVTGAFESALQDAVK